MTLVVPEIGADFVEDFEKLIMDYVFTKWSISDPPKGSSPIDKSNRDNVRFRVGLPDFASAYEISFIQTQTGVQSMHVGKERFQFVTIIEALIRMKRIPKPFGTELELGDGIDPQLGNMEREVQRIARHYIPNEIVGIKDIYSNGPDAQQRIYNATDTFAKSDWRSIVRMSVWYEKENIN